MKQSWKQQPPRRHSNPQNHPLIVQRKNQTNPTNRHSLSRICAIGVAKFLWEISRPIVPTAVASNAISCENPAAIICIVATITVMRATASTPPLMIANIAPNTNAASRIAKTADGPVLNIVHTTNKLIWQGAEAPCHRAAVLKMMGRFGLCGNYTWSTFPIVSAASFCAAVVTWA